MMRFVCAVLFSLVVCGGAAWAPPGPEGDANQEEALTTLKNFIGTDLACHYINITFDVWKIRDNGTREKLSAEKTHEFSVSMDDLLDDEALSRTNGAITLHNPRYPRTDNHETEKIEVKGVSMEMTLDNFYDAARPLVETHLAQKYPTQDGFQVETSCTLSLFQMPETFNLVSHRIEKLELFYCEGPLDQKISDTLPNLKRLLLNIPLEDFLTLTPNWRKESNLPDSCRLMLGSIDGENFAYYPAPPFSKEDLVYSDVEPLLAHAGHNYGHKDWLEARGWSLDKLSNVGFYVQGQPCPWGELLPTGPCQVRITYPKIITKSEDNKVTEGSDPKSAKHFKDGQSAEGDKGVPPKCLETMPNDILLIIFEQLNPLDKLSMIKAAPGLYPLILSTMKHDFTLQYAPKWHLTNHYCYSFWTFKTANPRAEKPEEFEVMAALYDHRFKMRDGKDPRLFGNYFVAFYGYDSAANKVLSDDPLWVCGPFGQNGLYPQRGQDKISWGDLTQALTSAAWKEFQAALAEDTFTMSDHYHFANGYFPRDLRLAPPPSEHGAFPAQKPDCVGEDVWALAQVDAWLDVMTPFERFGLRASLQEVMKPNSFLEIPLRVVNLDIRRETIFFILASVLNYSSVDAFYASLQEIAADLFQGYPDVPQKLRLGATSCFTRRLTINNCDALSDTLLPLTIPVHTLQLYHFRLPASWTFRDVSRLLVVSTDRSFDPKTLDRIQGGAQPIKVYLKDALSVPPNFSGPKCQVNGLSFGALERAGHNLGWVGNERYCGAPRFSLYYHMPDQCPPEESAEGEIFERLLTLSGSAIAPNEAGTKVLGAYGPEFDALMATLLKHGQVEFGLKQINYKTPQDKERMEALLAQVAQCSSQKRLCALEDSDSLQWIQLDEAFSKQHDIPYLNLFAGVPFLKCNKLKIKNFPQAKERLKILHEGVAEHIFDVVWRGSGGELLARFSNLKAQQLERFYFFFCPFALFQSPDINTYFHRILIDICRQQETLVVQSTS